MVTVFLVASVSVIPGLQSSFTACFARNLICQAMLVLEMESEKEKQSVLDVRSVLTVFWGYF